MVRETTRRRRFRDRSLPQGRAGRDLAVAPAPAYAALGQSRRVRSGALADGEWQGLSAAGLHPVFRGARVCPGAGFAMMEGPLLLALLLRRFRFETCGGADPVPVAFLTVRARDGIMAARDAAVRDHGNLGISVTRKTAVFPPKNCSFSFTWAQDLHGFGVAEHDHLARVLDGPEPAPVHLFDEGGRARCSVRCRGKARRITLPSRTNRLPKTSARKASGGHQRPLGPIMSLGPHHAVEGRLVHEAERAAWPLPSAWCRSCARSWRPWWRCRSRWSSGASAVTSIRLSAHQLVDPLLVGLTSAHQHCR
jgi:hypothetical protein